ncbi:MAG TPA: HAD-IC family P-type ATPase, partial [Fimbriimonas sp.]|nr:HAD-IC family P-type ATPase [Fimbriimonas sp.]
MLISVMREPMLILLVGAVAIYLTVGDRLEALMLAVSAIVIVVITVVQERRSERAVEALRDLSSPRATVVRDGLPVRIAGAEVVPDDLILLKEGDRVAADGRIVSSANLSLDESLLTGESVPVAKQSGEEVMSGTLVVTGEGSALVTKTGGGTMLGQIGASLATITEDSTDLQRSTRRLVRIFAAAATVTCVVVSLIYGFAHGSWISGVLAGITTAMSAIPEEFPLVLTVFLALGALRLAKRNVLTRRVSSIEALGAATVLCVDKTGTLTQNRMNIVRVLGDGQSWSANQGN